MPLVKLGNLFIKKRISKLKAFINALVQYSKEQNIPKTRTETGTLIARLASTQTSLLSESRALKLFGSYLIQVKSANMSSFLTFSHLGVLCINGLLICFKHKN